MGLTIISQESTALAKRDETKPVDEELLPDIEQIKKRLEMLDRRFDNVDSIVSVVAERVMKQPITLNITCPKCGHKMEIAIIGTVKPNR
jgi:hypothetical protein